VVGAMLSSGLSCSCENGSEPTFRGTTRASAHPAGEAARAYLDALKYRDADSLFEHHVAGTRAGSYCGSETFQRIWSHLSEARTERDCEEARVVTERRPRGLGEEARLAFQVLRFQCEHPEASCRDYAREVFDAQRVESLLWRAPLVDYEIGRIISGESEASSEVLQRAVAYVDLTLEDDAGERGQTVHTRLSLRRVDSRWLVETPIYLRDEARAPTARDRESLPAAKTPRQ
jgi:hypothetical protein